MSQHVVPKRVYYLVFLSLIVLTGITIWVAFHHFGPFNDALALIIATTKASLVILYFMHVRYSNKIIWLFVIGGFLFLSILLTLTISDVITRDLFYLPSGWSGNLGR